MQNGLLNHKIYDAVHGFIRFNDLEKSLIDSEPFQRLHYLHQLGIAFLVYPGATHTRFAHSLGTMELATRIFDQVTQKISTEGIDIPYWRQVVRLAALCHDLGHLPFSHVAEKQLLQEKGHEAWTRLIMQSDYLTSIWKGFQIEDLIKTALGPSVCTDLVFSPWERVMSEMITGDFFGADRIDYLLRDAQCTGVSYGLFDYHQLIDMLCILPAPHEGSLGVEENGVQSCEALLLARHFMHERVYQYPAAKAYTFHLSRFMEVLYAQEDLLASLETYLSQTDNEVLVALRKAASNPEHPGHEDACALLKKTPRVQAVPVPSETSATADSFLVLKRSGAIVESTTCSSLFIPKACKNWVFLT